MEREHSVLDEESVVSDAQHSLHKLVAVRPRNVLEAVQPVTDVLEAAATSELPQLDAGHAELFGILRCDEAVLVKSSFSQTTTICLNWLH